VPKIVKIRLHLLKLFGENRRSFFPDTVYFVREFSDKKRTFQQAKKMLGSWGAAAALPSTPAAMARPLHQDLFTSTCWALLLKIDSLFALLLVSLDTLVADCVDCTPVVPSLFRSNHPLMQSELSCGPRSQKNEIMIHYQ